jgi:hypothetical protein
MGAFHPCPAKAKASPTRALVRLEFPSGWQRLQRSGGPACARPRSPAACELQNLLAAGPVIGRNRAAAGSRPSLENFPAGADIVRGLARPLSIRCEGFSDYFVRDFGLCYQACWSFFPRDLGGSVVRPRELPETAHYKSNGFLDCVDCATRPTILPSAKAEWPGDAPR